MYQHQVPQPREENWSGSGPKYEAGYIDQTQQSDQLADAIARRLQSQAPSSLQTPVNLPFSPLAHRPNASMRLALAIVSVCVLIPLAAIALGGVGGFSGLVGLGMMSVVVLGVNFVFNYTSK